MRTNYGVLRMAESDACAFHGVAVTPTPKPLEVPPPPARDAKDIRDEEGRFIFRKVAELSGTQAKALLDEIMQALFVKTDGAITVDLESQWDSDTLEAVVGVLDSGGVLAAESEHQREIHMDDYALSGFGHPAWTAVPVKTEET